VEEFNHFQ